MNTQPTKADLRRRIRLAGGTLEEDSRARDMRIFQACSQNGMRWRANGCIHYRFEWATRKHWTDSDFNQAEWARLCKAMEMGQEPIPAEEMEQYATD